jgi:hypothetical protein
MKPPYRSPVNNTWYTEALFWDRVVEKPLELRQDFEPPFTLYDEKPGFVCVRTTFVALMDPTGYKWAQEYLGDYAHWKKLIKSKWFQEAYDVWMDEMKMKIRSEALKTIKDIAEEGQPAQALVAAKYLAGFEWEKHNRGRPSSSEIQGELKKQAKLLTEEDEDAKRIGLRVVK